MTAPATAPASDPPDPPAFSPAYLRYALGLLTVVYVINFVDRQVWVSAKRAAPRPPIR